MDTDRRYKAYLVRLWQPGHADDTTWHASIEDAHSGARYSFASLEMLFAFLDSQTHGSLGTSQGSRPPIMEGGGTPQDRITDDQ